MMLRNFTIALAIVAVGFVGFQAAPTSALSVNDVQAQIQKLVSQIAELTTQLNRLRGQVMNVDPPEAVSSMPYQHRICNVLARNLAAGAQGDDVRGLQEFLYENKFLAVKPTGYFGENTQEAVRKWQSQEGVSAVGSFGPLSRERIKIWCGGGGWHGDNLSAKPNRGDAPLTVNFYTKLSGFRPNTISYTLDYGDGTSERAVDCYAPADGCVSAGTNTHIYSQNGTYTATLNKITNTCPPGAQCFVGPISEVVGQVQINVGPIACTKEYKPVCGSKPIVCITTPCNPIPTTYGNRCEMNADGASFLYEGQCRSENPVDDPTCKAWFDGCNSCARNTPGEPAACTLKYCAPGHMGKAYCTARFDQSGNQPPVISGFSGPTTLAEDVNGTWTIRASDPEGGSLSYQVWWGDENIYAANMTTASAAREFTQSTTFTHVYSNPGTYTVQITVHDSAGQEAKTSSTVHVGSATICTMEYAPVCGQPPEPACRHSIPACMMATPGPRTYGNRCVMNADGASFLYEGPCSNGY